jgi:hypothetical protein
MRFSTSLLKRAQATMKKHAFEWRAGKQYWWQNYYDPALDTRTGVRKQIKLTGPMQCEETMAIYITLDLSEIAARIRNLFNVPDWQNVTI